MSRNDYDVTDTNFVLLPTVGGVEIRNSTKLFEFLLLKSISLKQVMPALKIA